VTRAVRVSGALRSRLERAAEYGFTAAEVPGAAFVAKPGSHDDGPAHGMFLGPIGGPVFSRDLTGRFSRWHLQPGTHLVADLDCAFLVVHWEAGGTHRHAVLRRDAVARHEVSVLFPVTHERFSGPDLPFVVTLSAFSPVVPGYEEAASLPVVVFDVHVEPVPGCACPAVDVAFFWPNLNGWNASMVTSRDRGDRAWPAHHHAGNVNRPVDAPVPGVFVAQGRRGVVAEPGEICLSVSGDAAATFTSHVQFKTDQNATGVPPAEQPFTIAAVLHAFTTTGRLGTTPDGSWEAHWHEPVGSAVAAHVPPGGGAARFVLAFDHPTVRFGQGRRWTRRYAAQDGERATAVGLAAAAHKQADAWLVAIDDWHVRTLDGMTAAGWSPRVAGCVVNELGLVTALGTAWVDGTVAGHEPPGDAALTRREHLGLLEGFDEGYFYYDTSDLWHYAFPAVTSSWPRLADVVFADLTDALHAMVPKQRPVYRVGEHRPLLLADNLPHDLGSAPEDPFVRLNGYVMRDDPNTWRDSTPAFVLARLLHVRVSGLRLDDDGWRILCAAAELTDRQDTDGTGVPRHDEFGDSTWDNLALRGYSTYTAALCAGMWAVLAHESRARGTAVELYDCRLTAARRVLDGLWNGEFFRAASEGKYTEAVMPDSVMGLYYADMCGAASIVPRDRIARHLRSAYEICHRGYADGQFGPLLIGERERRTYSRDGGEELQVNEVLVGSGWLFAAMLRHYGLAAEADDVATSLRDVLYGGTGLQFRTPAAVDRHGRFRAPLNMRPLAAWWLAEPATATTKSGTVGSDELGDRASGIGGRAP
jgi:non-lysosomal glucosylceramidase